MTSPGAVRLAHSRASTKSWEPRLWDSLLEYTPSCKVLYFTCFHKCLLIWEGFGSVSKACLLLWLCIFWSRRRSAILIHISTACSKPHWPLQLEYLDFNLVALPFWSVGYRNAVWTSNCRISQSRAAAKAMMLRLQFACLKWSFPCTHHGYNLAPHILCLMTHTLIERGDGNCGESSSELASRYRLPLLIPSRMRL